ncbi:hypothetical protein WA026_020369 [Henosepilachna vigintioctopunctata]|uniref:C2 domain-containing protein n=1 Tax=Henosepilachna vigintioctopunctata TaxID=420089 RepID=A0AAW1UHX0_9CUCU
MLPKYTRPEQLGTEKQTFLITIAILEGRHYAWPNMDSVVIVQAFGKKETTVVVHNSDCPYYNEYFTFEKKATPEKIFNSEITFTVVQPRTIFRGRKVLGTFKVDVATVWDEPDHQFYNKWAVLNAPTKKYTPGARGYLKVNITLITKNISPTIPPTPKDVEIEGNLLLPHSLATERSKANFEFDIYKGEHFYANGKAPTSCVEISFSGNKGRTTLQKNTSFPVFNQRIVLRDMFPPLSQRIYVKIFFGKTLHAFNLLNFKDLISEVEEGVVPCFGPSFLHFYENENMEEYKGSLLLGIKTKLAFEVTDRKKQTNIVSIPPCSRDLFPLVEIRLFCVIFECSALDKRFDGNVIFRATIGNEIISRDIKVKNLSDKIGVRKINRNSRFLTIKNKKPFLSLALNAIDCRKKLYNFNMLDKILNTMV